MEGKCPSCTLSDPILSLRLASTIKIGTSDCTPASNNGPGSHYYLKKRVVYECGRITGTDDWIEHL